MSRTKVYIDGQSGTTGLQIHGRIEAREDLRLLRISDERRLTQIGRASCRERV